MANGIGTIKLRCTHCMFCALLIENSMPKGTLCINDPTAMQEVEPTQMICDWFEPSTSTQSLYQALEEEGL